MNDHSSWFAISDAATLMDQVLRVVVQLTVLVVVRSVVRRHRPDAWVRFRAWAVSGTVASIVSAIGWRLVVRSANGSNDSTLPMKGMVLITALDFAMFAVLGVLLVRALVRIAQPAPTLPLTPTPPYR